MYTVSMFLFHGRLLLGALCHDYSLAAYSQGKKVLIIGISTLHGIMQPRRADAHFGTGGLSPSIGCVYKATMGLASSGVVAKPGGPKRNTELLEAFSHGCFLTDAGMLASLPLDK